MWSVAGIVVAVAILSTTTCSWADARKCSACRGQDRTASRFRRDRPRPPEITVTFSKPMRAGGWFWVRVTEASFPPLRGQPRYSADHM